MSDRQHNQAGNSDDGEDTRPGEDRGPGGNREVSVSVDGAEVRTPRDTTPQAVLTAAGLGDQPRMLVRIRGKQQTRYTNPGEQIKVRPGEVFITVSTGPTPVS